MGQRLWQWLSRVIAGRMRQRVTRAGIGFTLTLCLVVVLAFLSGNNLLFLLLACLLAMFLMSGFLSRLSLAGLELDFVFSEHISARRSVLARMKLHNEKSWMPSFSIVVGGAAGSAYSSELHFPALPGGSTLEQMVEVHFARRGWHQENSFQIKTRFPFGFAERQALVTLRREVLVYPCLDPQPGLDRILGQLEQEVAAQVRGKGHDFYRIRAYEHGESARSVDWKATAHTGELQVREFARNEEPLVEICLDLHIGDAGHTWFERAIDCVAFLCWELSGQGARIRFRTQNFDRTIPAEADVYTILKYLALAEPMPTRNVVEPSREETLQVVLSAYPSRWSLAGWHSAQFVDLAGISGGPPDAAGSASGNARPGS